MKVLLDEDVPVGLRYHLTEFDVFTVTYLGWKRTRNGKLMTRAIENGCKVLVTRDGGFSHQRPTAAADLAIVLIKTRTGRLQDILAHLELLQTTIRNAPPGSTTVVP